MLRFGSIAAAAVLLGLGAAPAAANAGPITENFTFTASGFGSGAPFDPVTGSFTLSFDPASGSPLATLPSFKSQQLGTSYEPFTFQYFAVGRQVLVGDNCVGPPSGGCFVEPGTDQAFLQFDVDSAGAPVSGSGFLGYSAVGLTDSFGASSVVVSVVTGVPEPASLMLLATGILGLIFARHRRG